MGLSIREVIPVYHELSWYSEQARRYRDFPGFPNGSMHTALYEQAFADGSAVLLTGLGGDQLLEGTRSYYAEELAHRRWANLRELFRRDTTLFGVTESYRWLIRFGVIPLLPHGIKRVIRPWIRRGNIWSSRDASWLSARLRAILDTRRTRSFLMTARSETLGSVIC